MGAAYYAGMAKTRDHAKLEKRRLQAGKLFAKGLSAPEVARRLGVARQVASRWKAAWKQGGAAALASKGPAGPKPKLTVKQTQQVVQALLAGPAAQGYKTALWTLPRVAALIKDLTGVEYHPGHVWRLLGASGFSCQRPERRAIERDDQAIARWRREVWPALKKRRADNTEPLSLLTKAG
ncbi:MAG TPA: IS630 family transposase [Lacipirellulaceae bacterium]|nr:IS630 family transposase [Lacipirellulaceae bacterium]